MTEAKIETKTEAENSFLEKIVGKTGIYLSIPLCINAVTIPITYGINRTIHSEEKTVVFTNGQTLDFIVYTPVTLEQNMRGATSRGSVMQRIKMLLIILQIQSIRMLSFLATEIAQHMKQVMAIL